MKKASFLARLVCVVNTVGLIFQLVAPVLTLSTRPVFATSPLKSEISWDTVKNSFHILVNTNEQVDYLLAYQTPDKTEAVTSSANDASGNFSRDIYAGTCSTGGTCVPHHVLRGILKTRVKSATWIYAKLYTIDGGNLDIIKEGSDSVYDLTNEETTWLGAPTSDNLDKINLISSDSSPAPPSESTPSASLAMPSATPSTSSLSAATVAGEHGSLSTYALNKVERWISVVYRCVNSPDIYKIPICSSKGSFCFHQSCCFSSTTSI